MTMVMHSSPPSDAEVDRFFQALARPGTIASEPASTADALRQALRDEAEVLREAKWASMADASSRDLAVLAELKQRLLADGLLGRPMERELIGTEVHATSVANGVSPPRDRAGWMSHLSDWLDLVLRGAWLRPAGVALGAVFVSVIMLKVVMPMHESDGGDVVRGEARPAIVLTVPDPAARAQSLAEQLRAAGATVVVSPISASESILAVRVDDGARLGAVRQLLMEAGLPVADTPPYEITIRDRP